MNRMRSTTGLLLASVWLGAFGWQTALAQPAPLGPEVRVDTAAGKEPRVPRVAVQPGGDFEIAWGYLTDKQAPFVAARHFDAEGRPTDAAQVQLAGSGIYPNVQSVTARPQGFEVLWQLGNWPAQPHYLRRLDRRGVPDPAKPLRQGGAAFVTRWVWDLPAQGPLAGWQIQANRVASGLAVQHLDAAGRLTGPVVRLNSFPVYVDERPLLETTAGGGFLAVWNGAETRPTNSIVSVLRARLFSSKDKPLGSEFDVSSMRLGIADILFNPRVATSPAGGFAISWMHHDTDAGSDDSTSYLRFFDAAGRPLGREIAGAANEWVESMAFDAAGNALVLWFENRGIQGTALKVQLFDAEGAPMGPAASVLSAASGRFKLPARGNVAWGGSSWIVTWLAQADPIGRPSAIFVRRFAAE